MSTVLRWNYLFIICTFWSSLRRRGSVISQLLQPRVDSRRDVAVRRQPPALRVDELLFGHKETLLQPLVLRLQRPHFVLELLHHLLHFHVPHPGHQLASARCQLLHTTPVLHQPHQLGAQPEGWGRGGRLKVRVKEEEEFNVTVWRWKRHSTVFKAQLHFT